ncbi:unnamed protein product [Parascedosporium putredinis]|uniref:Uncharacterized protein n=1 Tax=Parascedosporium putredinis TaxID=1442378 RepID=A0A9P1MAD9_9PEZI|nr:unnamed protein product [Parascedosporium putredinis]CAI7993943.1 unnamed protein product [Parascedosporium putredinis]
MAGSEAEEPTPAQAQPFIEPDNAETADEDEGIFDERVSTYTASLSSSVIDYPTEHGRRYHAFRSGKYIMPNDDRELVRLDLLHVVMVRTVEDKLHHAPIDPDRTHSVLDIGTGTGVWAMEFGDEYPGSERESTCPRKRLQPHTTGMGSPNVKFEVDDVESEWTFPDPFDFIFCRYMAGSIADWPNLVKNVHDHLNPGGWAEFQDYDMQYRTDDDSLTDEHSTSKWLKVILGAANKVGRNPSPGPKLATWARDAGFENVTEKVFKMPIGPWPKDPYLKETGLINAAQVVDGLEGFSMRLLCGVEGWSETEVQVLLAQVRKELKGKAFHSYVNFHVVYGQKAAAPATAPATADEEPEA